VEERRRSVRQKCRLRGRIYFYDGRKSVPCGIRDISYEGARIELLEPIDIPDAIDLYIPQKHRTMHASVRWRHANRIGVSFSSVLRNIAVPAGNAVLSGSISVVSESGAQAGNRNRVPVR
jgi:hypothetical protein